MSLIGDIANLAPTVGNIGGSILGGIGGAVTGFGGGALVPGADLTGAPELAGGVAGERIGQTAGGAGGQALGQWLKNALTGQKTTIAGEAGAAGEGAISSLGGNLVAGGLSKVFGKGLETIGKGAESIGAKTLAGQAAPGLIGPDLAKEFYSAHKITDLSTAGKVADVLTGSSAAPEGNALINKTVENALSTAKQHPGLDMSQYYTQPLGKGEQALTLGGQQVSSDIFKKAVAQNPEFAAGAASQTTNKTEDAILKSGLTDNQQNAIRAKLQGITRPEYIPQVNGVATPLDGLKFQRDTANLAREAQQTFIDSGRTDIVASREAKTYNAISESARDDLFSPIINNEKTDLVLSKADKDALIANVQKHVGPINQNSVAPIIKDIQDATTLKDLRAVQAKYVTVKQALSKTEDIAANNYGMTSADLVRAHLPLVGAMVGGPKAAALGIATGVLKNSSIEKGLSAGAQKVSALQKTLGAANSSKALDLFNRIGVMGAAGGTESALGGQGTNAITAAPLPTSPTGGGMGAQTTGQGGGMNQLQQAYQQELLDQQTLMTEQQKAPLALSGALSGAISGLGSNIANLAPQVTQQNLLGSALGGLPGAYNLAQGKGETGALGAIAGLIPGTAAYSYNQQKQADAAALGKALGIDSNSAMQLLPGLYNAQAAQQRGGILGGITGQLGGVQGAQAPMPAGQ